MKATQLVQKGITEIRSRTPWIGIVLQYLELVITEQIPTAATNGKQLLVNPDYAMRISFLELLGMLVHEALHVILRHMFRRGDRDPGNFNIACDHAINGLVEDMGYAVRDDWLKRIDGKTAEQLYAAKDDEPDFGDNQNGAPASQNSEPGTGQDDSENSDSTDSGDGSTAIGDDILDYPLEPGQSMADAEREVADMVAKAQATAAICGDELSDTEVSIIDNMSESTVDWHHELLEFIDKSGAADYSLAPPNLILGAQGIIANRLNPAGCGNVICVVDNSASINTDKLNQFLTELESLMDNIDYESFRVIGCNTRVNEDRAFSRGETFDISDFRSGGGTRFKPAFEHIAENYYPDLVIYFTDMELTGSAGPERPPYPVLWAVYGEMIDDNSDWADDYGWFQPDWGHRLKIA